MCPSYGTHGEGGRLPSLPRRDGQGRTREVVSVQGCLDADSASENDTQGLRRTPPNTHFDGTLQLRLFEAKPHHADDSQGHTQPVEEAEEVDDGEDVIGEGVHQGHDTLKVKTGPGEPGKAVLMWEGARGHETENPQPVPPEHNCLLLF